MKRKFQVLSIILIISFAFQIFARPVRRAIVRHNVRVNRRATATRVRREITRVEARKTLAKTLTIIRRAQKLAIENGVSKGLGLAIRYHRASIYIFRVEKRYRKAIIFSIRARRLAIAVIKANKAVATEDLLEEEKEIIQDAPTDQDLDQQLYSSYKDVVKEIDDSDALKTELNDVPDDSE